MQAYRQRDIERAYTEFKRALENIKDEKVLSEKQDALFQAFAKDEWQTTLNEEVNKQKETLEKEFKNDFEKIIGWQSSIEANFEVHEEILEILKDGGKLYRKLLKPLNMNSTPSLTKNNIRRYDSVTFTKDGNSLTGVVSNRLLDATYIRNNVPLTQAQQYALNALDGSAAKQIGETKELLTEEIKNKIEVTVLVDQTEQRNSVFGNIKKCTSVFLT